MFAPLLLRMDVRRVLWRNAKVACCAERSSLPPTGSETVICSPATPMLARTPTVRYGLLLAVSACASPPAPVITRLQPTSGASGTIVRVWGTDLLGAAVSFDNAALRTLGSGDPLVFTVPYAAASGSHTVIAANSSHSSSPASFTVTVPFSALPPSIDGYEFGYYSVGSQASEDDIELVVFGRGFDTNSRIVLNGAELDKTFIPGIPASNLAGLLAGGATLPNMDPTLYHRVVAVFLRKSDARRPPLGSTVQVAVRNVITGVTSPEITARVPARRILVEVDKLATADWNTSVVERDGYVASLRRPYTEAGILIDWRFDQGDVPDPFKGTVNAGSPLTTAELIDLALVTKDDSRLSNTSFLFPGEWYSHLLIVPAHMDPNLGGLTLDLVTRQAMAIFPDNLRQVLGGEEMRLRATAHELGHSLGMMHCEGDARWATDMSGTWMLSTPGRSLMNQWIGLNPLTWNLEFAARELEHFTLSPEREVKPGPGQMAANDPARREGECFY
jgi:hypothetical protein